MVPELNNKELVNLSIVWIISVILATFNICVRLIDKIQNFFETFTSSPIAQYLINFGFLYLVGLLWLTYRHWQEASRKREEVRNVIETMSPDVFILIDIERNILMCNNSVRRMFGYSANEVIKQKTDLLYFDRHSDPKKRHDIFEDLKGEGFHLSLATGIKKNGETIPLEIIMGRLSSGDGAVLLLRDVTERSRAEQQRDEAEAANRAKSALLASASHEIRTPMNAIIGMAELVLGTQLTTQQKEYLWTLKTSADSLVSLLNQILDLSKIEAGELELDKVDFDLRTTLEEAADMLAVRAQEAGLELACHIKPGVPEALVGDPVRLRQIVINLTTNAIKFTPEGQVTISVETQEAEDSLTYLHFAVSDTGIGIPSDKTGIIFESFKQVDGSTSPEYGGTGLGLAISKQLVEMMRGKIWVESELGKGSTFHFTACFELGRADATEAPPTGDSDLSGLPVLILDNNATSRLVLKDMTHSWGLEPAEAADEKEALALLEKAFEAGKPFKVLLLDARLPGKDEMDVAKQIRGGPYGADLTMILLTSVGRKPDAAQCAEVGISGSLVKPVKQSDLFNAIMMAVGHPIDETDPVITPDSMQKAQRRLSILLAEDNPVNQKVVAAMLKKRGHLVVIASNGKEALDTLDTESVDLILMDVQMPEVDGFEAARRIREKEKANGGHIPIVAMTAQALAGDRERCLAAGMDDYIPKPISQANLFSVIEN